MQRIPVLSASGQRLMPCHAARARQLIRLDKAVKRHDRGLVYLVLTQRSDGETQPVVLGIDPGSKKEAFVVQSGQHTLLSIQADAVTWVKVAVKRRAVARRLRRNRKCPHRQCRPNRLAHKKRLPPSTRARWGLKVRITRWLARYYPLSAIVIEDVKARTKKGQRRWNAGFSPLEVGKQWCYAELEKIAILHTVAGYDTKQWRDDAGLHKSKAKMADRWDAHCVDAFVLANAYAHGPAQPTRTQMLLLAPVRVHRRQLHYFNRGKEGRAKPYGGTNCLGLKKGAWVWHTRRGLCYVGGASAGRIRLLSMQTGERLTQYAKVVDCTVLCTAAWRIKLG